MKNAFVLEVTEQNFQQEVIERSKTVPVVVDFWAEWCSPCRTLGPALERETEDRDGAVYLAKIDVDQNPNLSARYQVRNIPSVQAFRDGAVVAQFVGAKPPAEVKQFFNTLAPSEAEQLLQKANSLPADDLSKKEETFQRAINADPKNDAPKLALFEVYLQQNKVEEAKKIFSQMRNGSAQYANAEARLLRQELKSQRTKENPRQMLDEIDQDPQNLDLRWSVAAAFLLDEEHEDALREFLEIVKRDRSYRDDGARKAMISIFSLLGNEHELTVLFRKRLSMALY